MENKVKTMKTRIENLLKAIESYSKAYHELEELQKHEIKLEDRLMPIGDQKTGAIGEFYALMYLKKVYPKNNVRFCKNPIQKGYDIEIISNQDSDNKKISIKTVSEFSKTKKVSNIKKENEDKKTPKIDYCKIELHIISLNKEFKPNGYWILNGKVCDFKHKSITVSEENMENKGFGNKFEEFKEKLNIQ